MLSSQHEQSETEMDGTNEGYSRPSARGKNKHVQHDEITTRLISIRNANWPSFGKKKHPSVIQKITTIFSQARTAQKAIPITRLQGCHQKLQSHVLS